MLDSGRASKLSSLLDLSQTCWTENEHKYCESSFHYDSQQLKQSTGHKVTLLIRWSLTLHHLAVTHYVALSRVRTLDRLNLCDNKIHISSDVQQKMEALRADCKTNLSLHFPHLHHHSLQVTFLNERSLHKHISLLQNDPILSASHISLYCEIRLAHTDPLDQYNIDSFQAVMYPSHSSSTKRPLSLYSKLPVLQSCQPVSLADSFGADKCALVQVAVMGDFNLDWLDHSTPSIMTTALKGDANTARQL